MLHYSVADEGFVIKNSDFFNCVGVLQVFLMIGRRINNRFIFATEQTASFMQYELRVNVEKRHYALQVIGFYFNSFTNLSLGHLFMILYFQISFNKKLYFWITIFIQTVSKILISFTVYDSTH